MIATAETTETTTEIDATTDVMIDATTEIEAETGTIGEATIAETTEIAENTAIEDVPTQAHPAGPTDIDATEIAMTTGDTETTAPLKKVADTIPLAMIEISFSNDY